MLMHVTDDQFKHIVDIMSKVMNFNQHGMDAKMTFKCFQDRVELVTFRNLDSGGILYDAFFTTVAKDEFDSDLDDMDKAINNMYKTFLRKEFKE